MSVEIGLSHYGRLRIYENRVASKIFFGLNEKH